MPHLNIQTNVSVDKTNHRRVLSESSRLVADILGKPEEFIMVALTPDIPMIFAGSHDPVAYLELKTIGLPGSETKVLCKALCELIEKELSIPSHRVYVKFNDVQKSMWGWKGSTFE